MKKRIILPLVILLVISIAVACRGGSSNDTPASGSSTTGTDSTGSGSTGTGSTSSTDTSTDTGDTSSGDETVEFAGLPYIEFDWYTGFGNDGGQQDVGMVFDVVSDYLLEKLNAKVNLIFFDSWTDPYNNMAIYINSGQNMGMMAYGPSVGVNYLTTINNGGLAPIEGLLDEFAPGSKAMYPDNIWDAMTVNGSIYGVPSNKDLSYIQGGVYNETMANALGIDMSRFTGWTNVADVEDLLNEVWAARNEQMPEWGIHPLIHAAPGVVPHSFAVEVFAGGMFGAVCNIPGIMQIANRDANTVFNLYETPEFLEYAKVMARLAESGILRLESDADNYWDGDGGYFLWVSNGWILVAPNRYSDDFDVKAIPPARTWTDTNNYYSAGLCISSVASQAERERAMMVIELLNTDPYLATLMRFGIEGQHWQRDANGKMTQEGTPRNSDASAIQYQQWYGAFFGNLFLVEAPERFAGPENEFFSLLSNYNVNAHRNHMGFVLDQEPIINELSAVGAVVGEFQSTLQRGELLYEDAVVSYINEFNEKLYANGLQRVIDEVQTQLDTWKASR